MKQYILAFVVITFSFFACNKNERETDLTGPSTPETTDTLENNSSRQIVFISDQETTRWQIFMMNADGSNQRRITNDSNHYTYVNFFPDGSKLIANNQIWAIDATDDIFTLNVDGSELTNLTNSPGDDNYPRISPDGSKIVFTSTRDGNSEIYIMDSDGNNQTRLTYNSVFDHVPQFYDHGNKILFISIDLASKDFHIHTINSDGSNLTTLTEEYGYKLENRFTRDTDITRCAYMPGISPDESRIAFLTYYDRIEDYIIKMMDINGDNVRLITSAEGTNLEPRFSPDGSSVIYVSHLAGQFDLYEYSLSTRQTIDLTHQNLGHAYFMEYSPNGSKILLLGDPVAMYYHIYTMNTDGTNVKQLTDGNHNNYSAHFQPTIN